MAPGPPRPDAIRMRSVSMPRVLYCLPDGTVSLSSGRNGPGPARRGCLNGPLLAASRTSVDEATAGATNGLAAEDSTGKEAAAAEISGSRRPGVIDHLLQRPLPDGPAEHPRAAEININYPSLGRSDIDADIRQWVTGIADAFEEHLDINAFGLPSTEQRGESGPAFELWGSYSVSWPSDAAVSIIDFLKSGIITGGSTAILDIMTLNYSLITGQRLGLVDLFPKRRKVALHLMSALVRRRTGPPLRRGAASQMLKDGTEPLVGELFSLTLTPEGICINFQPIRSRPGPQAQKVNMPLEELLRPVPCWPSGAVRTD